MLGSVVIAFAAGVVTVASPCVLPLLPVILASSAQSGHMRPWGVLSGFIIAFSAVTLTLATIVNALGVHPDVVRLTSAALLSLCGLVLLVPRLSAWFERQTGPLANASVRLPSNDGFLGGFVSGVGLGLAWTPCVGPVMAAVLTLAMNQQVTLDAALVTFAFALGTALPMVAVIFGGRLVLRRFAVLQTRGDLIKKVFGVLLIVAGLAIASGFDRTIQIWLYELFPHWEEALTGWENSFVN